MGARQEGDVAQVAGHRGDRVHQSGGSREPDLLDGSLDHQCVREVVDVLAGTGEVDQLRNRKKASGGFAVHRGEATLEVVLDGLDVVGRLPLELGEVRDVAGGGG